MKTVLFGDTHLGLYSDSDAWLEIVLNFYKHIAKYCYKNKIYRIIIGGDFFHNRKSLNTKTQHQAHRIARILGKINDLHTYIIVGNHDCYYKNQINPNTLELFNKYDHITIIDKITKLDNILLVPWGEVPQETQGSKYCFGHFAINGFYMNDSYKCKDGLDVSIFKDFDRVFCSHFHTPSSNDNITYLGAPYGQTFHDAGGIRGFHTFEDGKLEFIEYEGAPKFVKIHTTPEPLDENSVEGNIIRIIFTEDFGTTRNQNIIDNILKCKPFLYSVDFTNIKSEDAVLDDDSIEMDSKEQIVDSYIDSQPFPTNIQINILKSMFKNIMKEAGGTGIKSRSAEGTKIECISVGFQNFLSFGSKWQDVDLHDGVNFVTGTDLDKGKSNGAGKSSFLETIPFALFGKTARDIRQDQIINWKNKKNCQVVFRFKINDTVYEIDRKLKPNKLLIHKDGVPIDQDAHKSDYQSMFEEIFGMDVKMFMSLVHSNVNSSANILNMKKDEKRKFLERMFGLEVFSKMNKLCNSKLKTVEEKHYKIEVDKKALEEKIESHIKMGVKFLNEIKSKEASIENVKESEEELEKLKEKNPTIEDDFKNLKEEINRKAEDFQKVTLEFEKWKSKLNAEVENLKKEIKNIEEQDEQRKKNKEIQERINKIKEKAGTLEEIQEKIENLNKESLKYEDKSEKLHVSVSDVEKDLVEIKTNLKNIEKNLELLAEGICPVCGKDVKDPKNHYKKEQTSFKRKITNRKKKLELLKKQRLDIGHEWDEIREKIKTLGNIKDNFYDLERQLKEVGSEKKKDELVSDCNDKINKIQETSKLYYVKRDDHKDKIGALKNKQSDLENELNIIRAKEKDLDIIKSQAEEVKNHIASLQEMIKEQNNERKESRKKIEEIKDKKLKLNDIKDYLNCIKDILKDENIKQYTIRQIIPFVNKQTNHYLSEVNYSFYVDIDNWLDVEIKGPGIRNASYGSLSGGERRGIDISLQLALLDVARTQAGIFPDLLTFDELLDSSIDSRGINELLKIVKTKQREFGGKIFIITHRQEVDNELYNNEYKIIKENGFSKIII